MNPPLVRVNTARMIGSTGDWAGPESLPVRGRWLRPGSRPWGSTGLKEPLGIQRLIDKKCGETGELRLKGRGTAPLLFTVLYVL